MSVNLSAQTEKGIVEVALGSQTLANDTDINEFVLQENEIPELIGFIHQIFSTHPGMTRRVIKITNFHKVQNYS